jgi:hypothetical protein
VGHSSVGAMEWPIVDYGVLYHVNPGPVLSSENRSPDKVLWFYEKRSRR